MMEEAEIDVEAKMSNQLSLFDLPQPREPPPPPKPKPARFRLPLEKHEVKKPWGKPDKKGNLFWEKMHKELEKLPESMREHFNYLTQGASFYQVKTFEKALRLYNSAASFDRIDFDVSRGALGESE